MRAKRSYYFLLILVLPLLFALQNPQISQPVHGISLAVLKPLFAAGRSFADFFRDGRDIVARFWDSFKNQEIHRKRILELEGEVYQLQEAAKENVRLKKLLDFRQGLHQKTVAARVIGWDPAPWRRALLLDKGKKHGVQENMVVVVPEGLAGRILEAGPQTSRAILLTDPDARVSALSNQSRASGIIAGDGSRTLKMTYLELDSGVAVGETIMASATSSVYPKNIQIGKITALSRDPNGLHLEAQVEPFVKFSQLEEVLCAASSPEK